MCHEVTCCYRVIVALAMLAVGLSGCGSPAEKVHPVSGRVTFQGKSVSAGMIRFSNAQAGIDVVANLHDGVYEIAVRRDPGLPEGTYHVAILPPRWDRPLIPPGKPMEQPLKPPACPNIPAKYHQPSTSGLTLTVTPGGNVFDVDMQP